MSTTELTAGALRRRRELQEKHRLQLASLDSYDRAVQQAARAQAELSRVVAETVEAFGGADVAAGLLEMTVKEVRGHVAAHEAAPVAAEAEPVEAPAEEEDPLDAAATDEADAPAEAGAGATDGTEAETETPAREAVAV